MRRDKLDRAILRVHWKVPKYKWLRCNRCEDDVKGETMWWFRAYDYAGTWKVWTCRRCAPLMSDFFRENSHHFKDLDISPILEEERQMRLHNERGRTPPIAFGEDDADV
jgi:hypothetical protein